MTERTSSRLRKIGILVIVWLALVVPKLFNLDQFVAVDEVNWLHRSSVFYSALMQGDFAGTFVNRTPGVITLWIEAAAFRLEVPYYVVTQEIQTTSYNMFELVLTELGIRPLDILHTARILMVLFVSTILLGCFYYAARLFGRRAALVGILLLAFDPFITALTRTSHLDAPQAVLMLLSLLSLSSYLFVKPRWQDMVLSGAAGGMALLAKMPGIFIVPTVGLLLIVHVWRSYRQSGSLSRHSVRDSFKIAAIWGAAFVAAFVLLWPPMWAAPLETLKAFFGQAVRYSSTATQTIGAGEITQPFSEAGVEILSVQKPELTAAYFFRYPVLFLWRSTPVVLAGILLFTIFSALKTSQAKTWMPRLTGIWIMIVIYTVGMTLPWKTSDKYYAPVFMLACILAGLGWFLAGAALAEKTGKQWLQILLVVSALVVQSVFVLVHHPYYFTYYDPLMGGGQRASQEILVGVGEGLDVAARILDGIPDSQGLRVMSWYGIGPFSYYFDGTVEPLYDTGEEVWTQAFVSKLQRMDFLVIYTNQKLRGGPERLFELLSDTEPKYTITLHGIDYAWIYNVNELPLSDEIERLYDSPGGE